MIESKEKRIDGSTYKVTMLPATKAYKMATAVLKMVGPALARAAEGMAGKSVKDALGSDLSELALGTAVDALVDRLDDHRVEGIISELASVTVVRQTDGSEPTLAGIFDAHFAGRIGAMIQWLVFALGVQLGDFFGDQGLGSLTKPLQNTAAE